MTEFVDEFLLEIDKIERFYQEKCQNYHNEYKKLKEAYKKFYYKDQRFQKKGGKLKKLKNIKLMEQNDDNEENLFNGDQQKESGYE